MLLSILPHSFVASSVRVGIHSISVLFIVNVLAFIFSAVGPLIVTLSMHIILFPVAFVHSSVFPGVYSISSNLVLLPVAFELAVIGPRINSVAVLHAVLVLADVLGPVHPGLLALALLHIVDPLALVATPVDVGVNPEAAGLIGLELAYVNIAFGVPEGALALCFVFQPVTLVDGAIDPFLDTVAAALLGAGGLVDEHLALVHAPVGKHVVVHEDQAVDVVPQLRQQVLVRLLERIRLSDLLPIHHAAVVNPVLAVPRLVLLIELWVITVLLVLVLLLLVLIGNLPICMKITFTIFSFNFVSFQWFERLLVILLSVVGRHYLRLALVLRVLFLARRLGTHDHFLVKLVLPIITVALTCLPHDSM